MKNKKNKYNFSSLKGYLFWALLSVFGGGIVLLTIETVTSGAEIAKLEKEESILADQNRELSENMVQSTSLDSIEKKAEELGFVKPEKFVYIGREEPVAKLP